ncbi:MAG: hypothetical protein V3T74_08690 [Gemmatimonadales bacterium]
MMRPAADRWYALLSLLAVASLAIALHGHRRALAGYQARAERIGPQLVRLEMIDRLIGVRLPDLPLTDPAGGHRSLAAAGRARIVWFVQVDECAGCLEASLKEWHALLTRSPLDGVVVLSGVDRRRGARIARRAGVRSAVLLDTASGAATALGLRAPSVTVVSDAGGLIVLADARFSGAARGGCGPGFLDRVAAIYGPGG